MPNIISALVDNRPGVLARVAGLFSARGFNIQSLAVGETDNPDMSRMTIVVAGDNRTLEQARKQLSKLIDTVKVQDFSELPHVERDLLLIKVSVTPARRTELLEIVQVFRGKVVDVADKTVILEVSGSEGKCDAFIKLMRPYGISELARTGKIALGRGD